MKKFLGGLLLLAITTLLCSWGSTGHYYISYRSSLFMPSDLLALESWATELSDHASDADDRKSWDPTEAPKHYINYEVFPGFNTTGRVYQTVDSAFSMYGSSFLDANGYLPYATLNTFDLLVDAFQRNDDADIIFYASDLGHYVADGHMPLHLTENYNGQFSGQNGVHSRIESTLVGDYMSQITTPGGTAHYITDVNDYVFQYNYDTYKYVDSLLDADAQAYAVSGSYSNANYYPGLWARCHRQMNALFHNASQALADLIYTAAVNGGQNVDGLKEYGIQRHISISPNPVCINSTLTLSTNEASEPFDLEIFDLQGKLMMRQHIELTGNTKGISITGIPQGIFMLSIKGSNVEEAIKLVVAR